MSLDHAILGFLSQRPHSGYDLKTRCFDVELAPFWTADQAQIYRTLDRLQRDHMVSSTKRRSSGRPDRRMYEITQSGRDSLFEWMSTGTPGPVVRDPLMLQLYFGSALDDELLVAILETRRASHLARLDALHAESDRVAADHSLPDRTQTLRQTAFDGSVLRERAYVEWLDECIRAIRDGSLAGSSSPTDGQRTERVRIRGVYSQLRGSNIAWNA